MSVVVSLLLSVDAPASTLHFADDVAFRAAWITITQVPLVFFLSTKRGPINILAGIPYDKINWLHKWVGRFIFISATTHVIIMKSSISVVDILLSHNKGVTVVRYGIASYFLLIWTAVSSILPIRRWSYRAFYINHWISTLAFLMVVLQHVPKYATTPIYMAFGFVALDKISIFVSILWINVSVRPLQPRLAKFRRAPGRARLVKGYPVEMLEPHNLSAPTDVKESTTMIRVCNVPISWRPGQHVRLYLPALGAFEVHPFTPANCSSIAVPPPLPPRGSQDIERRRSASSTSSNRSSDMSLMIRAHSGLTRRLKEFHTEWLRLPCPNATVSAMATSLTAYVDGPYGNPPVWENFENLVLIATSTGVSFALSIMDYLEQLCFSDVSKLRTQRIRFIWIVRHMDPQFEASVAELLRRYSTMMRDSGVQIETDFYVTCSQSEIKSSMAEIDQFAHLRPRLSRYGSGDRMLTIRNPDEIYDEWEEEERQWAEMEALEELQMKEIDPFVDTYDASSIYSKDGDRAGPYEGDGYAASETSTLLDGGNDEQSGRPSNTFSEVRLTFDETAVLDVTRPLSSPLQSPSLPRRKPSQKTCQCALVQYQRRKLRDPAKSSFDSTSYGVRPDIARIISGVVESDQHDKLMVAVCANNSVSRQANKAVSQAKFAFARGQRATDVEVFTEGFS
ncbi:oxidoreductase [Ascochyta rabiei]|uniref:Oxidoreductase n=2 Tax=Didymella rabiei TaxID=5454 RepID=A0A163B7P0_DIDRA|nr:oxidoreductase [Ascochyta rabiei]